jgi:hypothetical protein
MYTPFYSAPAPSTFLTLPLPHQLVALNAVDSGGLGQAPLEELAEHLLRRGLVVEVALVTPPPACMLATTLTQSTTRVLVGCWCGVSRVLSRVFAGCGMLVVCS